MIAMSVSREGWSWPTHLASCLLGALILAMVTGCSAFELGSGHAKVETRIKRLQAKVRELDKRSAAQEASPRAGGRDRR